MAQEDSEDREYPAKRTEIKVLRAASDRQRTSVRPALDSYTRPPDENDGREMDPSGKRAALTGIADAESI
ncbi:MAG: hypothetical protein D6753_07575 [Planctomycetota bacterium]|nr:MAG: hypothetical protein D6753_07575 [Planctomycetota bacterium]